MNPTATRIEEMAALYNAAREANAAYLWAHEQQSDDVNRQATPTEAAELIEDLTLEVMESLVTASYKAEGVMDRDTY